MTRSRLALRVSAVVAIAVLASVVIRFGLTALDAEAAAAQVRAAGALGPAVLFALLVLQCVVVPIPSEPLMMAAGFVYGSSVGFTIGWIGVVCGASACFGLARALGRPFAERFVRPRTLATVDAYVGDRGRAATFGTVLLLRLFAFTSFDVLSYGCGLVRFPFRWFLLATAVGGMPKVFTFTYFGANLTDRPAWLDVIVAVGTVSVLLLGPWLVRSGIRRQRSHSQGSAARLRGIPASRDFRGVAAVQAVDPDRALRGISNTDGL